MLRTEVKVLHCGSYNNLSSVDEQLKQTDVPIDFLKTDPSTWKDNRDYQRGKNII